MKDELSKAWADLPASAITDLMRDSKERGWRQAVQAVEGSAPFFAGRMLNLGLGNWHLLLSRPFPSRILDVGCGFGSMVLGFAQCNQAATVGVEVLRDRVAYAALRGAQERTGRSLFARASGLRLPFREASFGLVTMNGVLEWAGLYEIDGDPTELQGRMLQEARRVLHEAGCIAVAIENRYALESLMGMRDTHTGLTWITPLPRRVADYWSRMRKGQPYRTYLYGVEGYRRLFTTAGFETVRVFDLISSYNDYDFVVDSGDAESYRFIFANGLNRSFFKPTRIRRAVGRFAPRVLGKVAYAFLVVGGRLGQTALGTTHGVWGLARRLGLRVGRARFALNPRTPGRIQVIAHDGTLPETLLELWPNRPDSTLEHPAWLSRRFRCEPKYAGEGQVDGIYIRAYDCGATTVSAPGR